MIRPTTVSLNSLATAASVGVDLALQERTITAASDPSYSMSSLPDPSTTGIFPPMDPTLA